jgi:hypothetical protein
MERDHYGDEIAIDVSHWIMLPIISSERRLNVDDGDAEAVYQR